MLRRETAWDTWKQLDSISKAKVPLRNMVLQPTQEDQKTNHEGVGLVSQNHDSTTEARFGLGHWSSRARGKFTCWSSEAPEL